MEKIKKKKVYFPKRCSVCKIEFTPETVRANNYYCITCESEYHKNWITKGKNKEKRRIWVRNWKARNIEKVRKADREYQYRNRERGIKYQRERRVILRKLVINHYSNGKNECACCGESEMKFLSIDHINNDGHLERKKSNRGGGSASYQKYVSLGFPKGLQVLCFNCNFSKGHWGECPHETKRKNEKQNSTSKK